MHESPLATPPDSRRSSIRSRESVDTPPTGEHRTERDSDVESVNSSHDSFTTARENSSDADSFVTAPESHDAVTMGTPDHPVPLASLFDGPVNLSDVDFVPLQDAHGNTVGVGFPRAGEGGVLQDAFKHGAARPDSYSTVLHHDERGFAVTRKSDGAEIRLDENGLMRLLTSAGIPGGHGWRQSNELVMLSCRVADPKLGNRLGALEKLLRQHDYHGDVRGPDTKVTIYEDGALEYHDGGSLQTAGETADHNATTTPEPHQPGDHGRGVTFVTSTLGATPHPNLTGDYRTEGPTTFESVPPLTHTPHDGFPSFGRSADGLIAQDHPDLRVAEDGTLAINGTRPVNGTLPTNEAREFLATGDIVRSAQEALRRNGSPVYLETGEAKVVIGADGREQTLYQVTPRLPGSYTDVCRDFAEMVHGGRPDALLFRDEHGNSAAVPVSTAHSVEITGAFHMAEGLTETVQHGHAGDLTPARAADFAARDNRKFASDPGRPLPGHQYGAMLNPNADPTTRADLDTASRAAGINQYAWAKPGEMYVRSAVPGEGADGHPDYTTNAARDGAANHSGYHFATVIAESADGKTQVTLENYNHKATLDRAVHEAIAGNLARHAGQLGDLARDLDARARAATDPAEKATLTRHANLATSLAAIEKTGYDGAAPQDRQNAHDAMAAELSPIPLNQQWHFKMYTRAPGESFFEQQAVLYDTSARARAVNPLVTMVLGGSHEMAPRDVPFRRGETTQTATEHTTGVDPLARKIARAAVLRDGLGQPLPTVKITAAGDPPRLGGTPDVNVGRQRANHLRDRFRTVLDGELTRLQGDQRKVSADDIHITAEAARPTALDGPAAGHATVTPEFHDPHRGTPESRAATEYDSVTHGLGELAVPMTDVRDRASEFRTLAQGGLEQHRLPTGTRERLTSINDSLARRGDQALTGQVRALVTDALLASSLVPARTEAARPGEPVNRHVIQPVSPSRLSQLLRSLDEQLAGGGHPFTDAGSPLRGFTNPQGAGLPARLANLGLLNLSESARTAVAASPLFTALQQNPRAMVDSLYSTSGHEEQHFLNTCVAAAVNTGLRSRVPTLASMLHLGRAVADATEQRLTTVPRADRNRSDRPFGRTQGDMVTQRVAAARGEFNAIETRALALAADPNPGAPARREWADLNTRLARSMQKLAAADLSDPPAPVLTKKAVSGSWYRSGMLASPKIVDRPGRRLKGVEADPYLRRLRSELPREQDNSHFGANDQRGGAHLDGRLNTPHEQGTFWERVAANTGHVVSIPGHEVYVQAATVDGQRAFILNDPKYDRPGLLTPAQFAAWANENHAEVAQHLMPPAGHGQGVTMGGRDDTPLRDPDEDSVFNALMDLYDKADETGTFDTHHPRSRPSYVDNLPDGTRARADHLLGLDMTKSPTGEEPVVVERDLPSEERRYTWAGDRPRVPPLPELLELPRLVHSVWLGGAMRAAGAMAHFRANLERTARAAGDRWKVVLWTDISRDKLLAALRKHFPPPVPVKHDPYDGEDWDDLELHDLAGLYEWAASTNIALVNVDEVFNEDDPMDQWDDYGAESHKHSHDGYDKAAKIAANEILSRFGGVALSPDHYARDLTGAEHAIRSAPGWASGNGAVAMPQGHPAADLHRDALRQGAPAPAPVAPNVPAMAMAGAPAGLPGAGVPDEQVRQDLRHLDGFVPGDPAAEPPLLGPLTDLSVEDLGKRVIDALVQELRTNGGNLDLAAVANLVAGHPKASEVWTVALAFLATRPELSRLVHTVTTGDVQLPPRAAELISPEHDTLRWPDWL